MNEFSEALDIELPDSFYFDNYQDQWLLLTFGRQLVEIQYEYRESYYDYGVPFTEIIFTEEHHEQTMYVSMDKIKLWDASISGWGYNSFYVIYLDMTRKSEHTIISNFEYQTL